MSAPDPVSQLAAVLAPGRHGAPGDDAVRIAERRCDLVQVFARKGRSADVAAAMQAAYAITLPTPGRAAGTQALATLWIQPDAWLLVAPPGVEGALARAVKAACGDAASIVDQTHGRSVITLAGRRAPWVLGKLCRIDLHPRAFAAGAVASTPVAELSCVVHQRDAAPTYDLIVFTTFARAFAASLTHAAEETGYRV